MGLREGPRRPQWRGLAKQGGATAPTRAVPSCSGSRAGATFEVRVFRTLPPSLPTRNLRPGD